jgi:DNA-binding NarL/FixJ family response regulator
MARASGLGNSAMEAREREARTDLKLFVVDPHTIYRRGLAACLEGLEEVHSVGHADSVRSAWEDQALFASDLVLVDHAMTGGLDFLGAVGEATGASVVVCSSLCTEDAVLAALQAGAVGVLRKETLTTESLASAVRAAADGTGVVTSELLHDLLEGLAQDGHGKPVAARLTDREQQVLSLIAAGHPTREVAQQLCYSERTVKNVLHDVVTKMGARSRSQAVAHAVREGLI